MEFDQNQKETSIVKVLEVDCLNDNIKTEFDNRIKIQNNFHHIYTMWLNTLDNFNDL